jgi:hypothetical protein
MLVAACAFAAACDQAPGPAGEAGDPPVLSEFSFFPHVYAFPHDAEGEDLEVPLVMEVTATDLDDDLESVSFAVQSPVAGAPPLAQGTLSRTAGTHYEAAATLTIPSGEVGLYTVLVYAIDGAGSLSNDVRGMLRIEGVGGPPAIVSVVAPDTVQRPAAGEPPRPVEIVAEVSDPDGLANVNAVQFWNVDNPSVRIHMSDAGELGDEEAGDGRYTRVVEIGAGNQAGINTFAFQATDRSGLTSSIVQATIVVE